MTGEAGGISAEHIRLLLDKAESIGISGRSILRSCGLSHEVAQIGAPGGVRLTRPDFARLRETSIQRIRERLADPSKANMSRRDFNFMCHSLISSLTLLEAISRVCHLSELTEGRDGWLRWRLDEDGMAEMEITLGQVERSWSTFFTVNAFLLFSRLFSWLIGYEIPAHYRTACSGNEEDRMIAAIFHISLEYGAATNLLRFPANLLGRAVIRNGDDLREFLLTFPYDAVLAEEIESRIGTQVESLYRSAMAENNRPPRAADIARVLGMSPATLRRSLQREDSSLRKIKEDVRKSVATSYLASGRGSSAELSRRLGFSGPKAFERAFREWTGSTPRDFRRAASAKQI